MHNKQKMMYYNYSALQNQRTYKFRVCCVSGFCSKDHIKNGKKLFSMFQENLTYVQQNEKYYFSTGGVYQQNLEQNVSVFSNGGFQFPVQRGTHRYLERTRRFGNCMPSAE